MKIKIIKKKNCPVVVTVKGKTGHTFQRPHERLWHGSERNVLSICLFVVKVVMMAAAAVVVVVEVVVVVVVVEVVVVVVAVEVLKVVVMAAVVVVVVIVEVEVEVVVVVVGIVVVQTAPSAHLLDCCLPRHSKPVARFCLPRLFWRGGTFPRQIPVPGRRLQDRAPRFEADQHDVMLCKLGQVHRTHAVHCAWCHLNAVGMGECRRRRQPPIENTHARIK